jgi:hypothetical protein
VTALFIAAGIIAYLAFGMGSVILLIDDSIELFDLPYWVNKVLGVAGLVIWFAIPIYAWTNEPPCAIGHYETRHGITRAGNATIPTIYQAYVCDVYEEEK